jgi:hypothetical protein
MAVKHTPTGIVHKGKIGNQTGCYFDMKKSSDHWVDSHSKITCDKNWCRN